MIAVSIVLDGDNAWPDLKETGVVEAQLEAVAFLDKGMASGLPSVAMRLKMPDGSIAIAQTSGRLFANAARALIAKYPDLLA